ncbi:type II toxin-antitoxin system RelB/DinJ family antitoxin [Agrilactobacillus fermenti]|uniref:type II toxin-antitoxin system RelB/DinJ family antitoxin n=1 Tax=Agrilactobacillus fermenti TaxID=2586909 RepID=UPI001E63A8FA|nr:type II toxin-antitoxin system RelB/DinJ family antitoxin [Agrilactobacillus fermenti]MCD2256044.1 type II toxin-antitoxin system RelB/DinJ family antitoxin [Agrilactobacillus fermenti]
MDAKKKDTRLSIRIDPELKKAGQEIANDMGLDLTTAVTMFITKMVKTHELPFTPTSLPIETLRALKESEHPEKTRKYYKNTKDMWHDLDA